MTMTRDEFRKYLNEYQGEGDLIDRIMHRQTVLITVVDKFLPSEKEEKREEGLTDEMVSEIINDEIDTMRKMDRKSGLIIEKHPIEIHKDEKEEIMKGDWVYDLDGRRVQVYKTFAGRASCYDESKKYLYTYSLSQLSKTKPEKEISLKEAYDNTVEFGRKEKERMKENNQSEDEDELVDDPTAFELGDKVKVIMKHPDGGYFPIGAIGEIGNTDGDDVWPEGSGYFYVENDDDGWWYPSFCLEKIEEEEVDMKGLLCEGCGRTHLRCKCPENSVEYWKHRCEQYEKREKEFKRCVLREIEEGIEIDWAWFIDEIKEIYPLDREEE